MIVRATIYDENMQPFPMATASIEKTNYGVAADLDGKIELQAGNNDTIVIQAMGYITKKYPAYAMPPVIILKPSNDQLDEVVLTYKKKTNKLPYILTGLAIIGLAIKNYFKDE